MLFHVAATAESATAIEISAAMKSTLDEMKAEGVVLSACSCVDRSGYFLVVEAGDVDEAAAEITRLASVADQPLSISVTEVRKA